MNAVAFQWKRNECVMAATAAVIAVLIFMQAAGWTGPGAGSRWLDALYILATSLPVALFWFATAAGLGIIAQRLLRRAAPLDGSLVLAVGIALLLMLDAACGALGLLQWAGGAGLWIITLCCSVPFVVKVIYRFKQPIVVRLNIWIIFLCAPAVTVLAVAACSAPGWLWGSEFDGYDALSYHLQLPKEWVSIGRIAPLEHNVYSFLPGYMEATYYHIMLLRGDAAGAVYSCQLLHACMAIIAAALIARAVRALLIGADDSVLFRASALASAVFLGTPWVVVVGSLAYNEMSAALMLAVALVILFEKKTGSLGHSAVLGLLVGAAIGSKATSVGMIAAPVCAIVAIWNDRRFAAIIVLFLFAVLALSPWWVRNAWHAGNPTFPFLTQFFGQAHFSSEQIALWNAAHSPHGTLPQNVAQAFNQLFRYGLGPNPDPTGHEPWSPQWSILPWLALLSIAWLMTSSRYRRPAIILLVIIILQLIFWMFFTHIQSRFMASLAVPAAMAVAVGAARLIGAETAKRNSRCRFWRLALLMAGFAWCLQPLLLFKSERDGAPAATIGDHDILTGRAVPADDVPQFAAVMPTVMVNRSLDPSARVLLVGESAPFYFDQNKITYNNVWDRGPMSRIIAQYPSDPAQWISSLRDDGFTHVLFDPVMLSIWRQSGWSDPAHDPVELQKAFDQYATLIVAFPNGQRLYQCRYRLPN